MFPRRKLYKSLAIASLLLSPLPASAIGIGNIDILSHLNQPLLARINILASPAEGIRSQDLKVRLASRSQHAKYGLNYPQALKTAHFEVTPQPDGNFRVRATTSYPLKEPLINFLLEVDWKNGRLFKEVALLLDPPGYQQLPVTAAAAQEATPVEATRLSPPAPAQPTAPEPKADVAVGLPIFTRQPAVPVSASRLDTETYTLADEDLVPPPVRRAKPRRHTPRQKVTAKTAHTTKPTVLHDGQYGPVRPGDSLSKIAMKIAGRGASKRKIKALMKAIYVANPQAFEGSMDSLEKNSYLVIPSETDVSLGPSYLETSAAIGISDFVTSLSGNEREVDTSGIVGPVISTPKATTTTTAASAPPEPQGELKILPPDRAAADISNKLSQRMAELDKEAAQTVTPLAANEPTVDNDPAIAEPTEAQATIASDRQTGEAGTATPQTALLQQEIAELKAERQTLLERVSKTENKLQETEATLHKLELKINALTNSGFGGADSGVLKALLLKWLPWLLLLPLLPLLLFLVWRRRRSEAPVEVPQPTAGITAIDNLDPEAPFVADEKQSDDIETVESASRGIPPVDLDLGSLEPEFRNSDTVIEPAPEGLTVDIPETDTAASEAVLEIDSFADSDNASDHPYTDLMHADLKNFDHELKSTDTQESIRPVQNTDDSEVTQIINTPGESDSSLNAAQESEIYLAYGQYSLAEENINRLLALEPDNDRHKLLQLKLFAETARMNELQSLSVDLLQKYPDPNSGMHQQINNICERAFTKKAGKEATLTDQDQVETVDDTGSNTGIDNEKLPPLDITLSNMSVDADKLSNTYTDDIDDYMSEQTLADLDLLEDDEDTEEKTVFEDPLRSTSETAPSLELEDEADLTQSDLESLTVDMELQEAKLDLDSTTLDKTISEDRIEEFSDTDLRLEPINLDDPKNLQGRLDISFDLESELEKHVTKVNDDDTK